MSHARAVDPCIFFKCLLQEIKPQPFKDGTLEWPMRGDGVFQGGSDLIRALSVDLAVSEHHYNEAHTFGDMIELPPFWPNCKVQTEAIEKPVQNIEDDGAAHSADHSSSISC